MSWNSPMRNVQSPLSAVRGRARLNRASERPVPGRENRRHPSCRSIATCLGCCLLALWTFTPPGGIAGAQTQPVETAPQPDGVVVRTWAEPAKATVGDPVGIDFDVTHPPGYQVQFPPLAGQIGEFVILQVSPGPSVPAAGPSQGASQAAPPTAASRPGEPLHHRARVLVALYKPGDYTFPPITLTLKSPSSKEVSLASPAVRIRIDSVLTGKDEKLKDLKKQAEIPEPVRWLLWLGIALLVLILAGIASWFWRRRRRPAILMPSQSRLDPLQLAEAELRDLLGRDLIQKNLLKQFYVILSDIAKKMLEAGYGIHTVEKTTAEIMDQLQSDVSQGIRASEVHRIGSLLVAFDLVKFARSIPSPPENDAAVRAAFELLDICRQRRAASSTPGPAQAAEVR